MMIMLGVGQTITIITKGPDLEWIRAGSRSSPPSWWKAMWIFFPFAMLALWPGDGAGLFVRLHDRKGWHPFLFIATYGMQWAVFGFAYVILRGYVIYDFDPAFRMIGNGYLFGVIPAPVVVMIIAVGAGNIRDEEDHHGEAILRCWRQL
ncbi:MAG: hypothetical protein U5L98_08365 [Halomonas sp.]|uniref:hypothetical protein n=1 Tax=Halomonas sp. TaxID=1486246 RepID=UPI002ACDFC2C|nr:hypothetical protein [Halomonas sp.]MDZ7852642.1 hypothetical protein [Halomonas sp.]